MRIDMATKVIFRVFNVTVLINHLTPLTLKRSRDNKYTKETIKTGTAINIKISVTDMKILIGSGEVQAEVTCGSNNNASRYFITKLYNKNSVAFATLFLFCA